jgi:glycerol-3-phosphate dehydrogenase
MNPSSHQYPLTRSGQWQRFERENVGVWDVVVIGGGATGLGVALDAAARGLKTVLLEGEDFAKGTSSKSTKLIHGGVRYLAQGHIGLVMEALHERGLLYQNAPHLVRDLELIIPSFRFGQRGFYGSGLFLYDLLAGRQMLKRTSILSANTVRERIPNLRVDGLRGGVLYHDGQFDDSRLAVNLAQSAAGLGAVMLNYARVTRINADSKQREIFFCNQIDQTEHSLKARVIVNATGIFVDDVLSMTDAKHRKMVVPSQGSHVVLPRRFLGNDTALMIPKTSDGRVLFVIPWYDRLIVGTTDLAVEHRSIEPRPMQEELDFILGQASAYLEAKPSSADILSVYSGLRPLAAPKSEGSSTKEISRSHKIHSHPFGVVTVIGGKWTTYRKMAADTLGECQQFLGQLPPCKTEHLKIRGAGDRHPQVFTSDEIYGNDASAMLAQSDVSDERLHPRLPYSAKHVIWACRQEMAIRIEDVLLRRTRAAFMDATAALEACERVGRLMQVELRQTDAWLAAEVQAAQSTVRGFIVSG